MSKYKLSYTAPEIDALLGKAGKAANQLGGVSFTVTPDGTLNIAHNGESSDSAEGVDIMTDTTAKAMSEAIKVIAAANLSISRHLPKLRQQIDDLKNLVDSNKVEANEADEALSNALANLAETVSILSNTVNNNKKSVDNSLNTLDTALSNLTKEVANNKKTASDADTKLTNDIATTNKTIESLGLTVIDGKLCVRYKA